MNEFLQLELLSSYGMQLCGSLEHMPGEHLVYTAQIIFTGRIHSIVLKLYPISSAESLLELGERSALAQRIAAHSKLAPLYFANKAGEDVTVCQADTPELSRCALVVMQRLPGKSLMSESTHSWEQHALRQLSPPLSPAYCPLAQAAKGCTTSDDWFTISASCASALSPPLTGFAPSDSPLELHSHSPAVGGTQASEGEPSSAHSQQACMQIESSVLHDRVQHLASSVSSWGVQLPAVGSSSAAAGFATAPSQRVSELKQQFVMNRLDDGSLLLPASYWDLAQPQWAHAALLEIEDMLVEHHKAGSSLPQELTELLAVLCDGMAVWEVTAAATRLSCRPGWIHGDLNDCNILVSRGPDEKLAVSGIIDIDDAAYSYTVCDCAILAAYGAMGCAHPVEMLTAVICGWHSAEPMTESEIRLLPFLILSRCVQSAVASTLRWLQQGSDTAGYLQLHTKAASALLLELLPLLQGGPSDHAMCGLQEHLLMCTGFGSTVCGGALSASEGALAGLQHVHLDGSLSQFALPGLGQPCSAPTRETSIGQAAPPPELSVWSPPVPPAHRAVPCSGSSSPAGSAAPSAVAPLYPAPVCAYRLNAQSTTVLDFSASGAKRWADVVGFAPENIAAFHRRVADVVFSAEHTVAWGRYGEDRMIYASSHFSAAGETAASGTQPESRSLHLGVDLFLPEHSPVFAPYDGVLHSFAVNGAPLDYGTAVILRHEAAQVPPKCCPVAANGGGLFSLYGHLSPRTYQMWAHRARFGDEATELDPGVAAARAVRVRRGGLIGWVGGPPTNGGWAPHLHFQIMTEDPTTHGKTGDFAGVCKPSEWPELYSVLVPDPRRMLDPEGLVDV